jgi:hypothetical protein
MSSILVIGKEIKELLNKLNDIASKDKSFEIIHRDNNYNKNFSILLSAYEDVYSFIKRLEKEIETLNEVEHIIQRRNRNRDSRVITKKGQRLRQISSELTKNIEADFKALYIFLKIFLDKYIQLLCFIKPVRNLKHNSITQFIKSLKEIPGGDNFVNEFKRLCTQELDEINKYLTFYRDKFIVHSTLNQNFTVWFINDMRGNVQFSHVDGDKKNEINSLSPRELLLVSKNFIELSTNYFVDNWTLIKK